MSNLPKIEISQKPGTENQAMTSANTVVKVNGQQLEGIKELSFSVKAGSIAEVTFKMIADTSITGNPGQVKT